MVAQTLDLRAVIVIAAARLGARRPTLRGLDRLGGDTLRRALGARGSDGRVTARLAAGRGLGGTVAADLRPCRAVAGTTPARCDDIILRGRALDPDRARGRFRLCPRAALGTAASTLATAPATLVAPATAAGSILARRARRQRVETAAFL
ncbi:MAG: hypothetical protein Q8R85_12465, partial [Bosea sp. (in: a-proteobacteria)]|uniref:hypothetical protein n=1 Tax=Bosea sp. (in: a-proteobacteria) TaxID=1871050 RepID=UPI00273660DC